MASYTDPKIIDSEAAFQVKRLHRFQSHRPFFRKVWPNGLGRSADYCDVCGIFHIDYSKPE